MSERIQALFAEAVRQEHDAIDLEALVEKHEVEPDDAAALSGTRLALYRRLVRHNVVNVIDTMLERTRARLDHFVPGAFEQAVSAWIAAEGPRTPHLRDVPREMLDWAAPRWRSDSRVPAWIADYAEYELAEFTIGVAPRPAPPPPLLDVTADRALVFADPHLLLHLRWAVHELDELASQPMERATSLLVYRDADANSRFLDLTPLAAAILERLLAGRPLAAAMTEACAATNHVLDQAVLGGAAQLLADLGERGVLLGATSAQSR